MTASNEVRGKCCWKDGNGKHFASMAFLLVLVVCPLTAQGGGTKGPTNAEGAEAGMAPGVVLAGHPVCPGCGACCFDVPAPTCTEILTADCIAQGGRPQAVGTDCHDNDGDGVADACEYKNWVVADDFMVTCPTCTCDLNGDGVCDAVDSGILFSCCMPPSGLGCGVADLNCNGIVECGGAGSDLDIFNCLLAGGTPDVCCDGIPSRGFDSFHWWGSYFDTTFEPPADRVDAWLLAVHRDIPAQACPNMPIPPGGSLSPVDLCGTLIQGVQAGCILFQPKGSVFQYVVQGPLGPYGPGDMVRICGLLDPNCITTCLQGSGCLNVNAVMECDTAVSRPGPLVVQWAYSPVDVVIDDKLKAGCDLHRVFGYSANVSRGCIQHDFSLPGEYDIAGGVFYPRPNEVYWLSIQASVGHRMTGAPPFNCQEVSTGRIALREFWGWHTTPPGYHAKDDAYVGMVRMGCNGEWIYDWNMGHLHWSDPRYIGCADDPTKSMDMAYQLWHRKSGLPYNLWCQQSNPGGGGGGPIPVRDEGLPEDGGLDEFANTTGFMVVESFNPPMTIQIDNLQGPTVVARKPKILIPLPAPPGTETVPIEIVALELTGSHPLIGPVRIHESPSQPSPGAATKYPNNQDIPSFFDVVIIIDLPGIGQSWRSQGPVRVQSSIFEVPPSAASYEGPPTPVVLVDVQTAQPRGRLLFVRHIIGYQGGINIHSDADWINMPMDPCCAPDPTGTVCQGACTIAGQQCVPTKFQCSPGVVPCTIIACDCQDPNLCHVDLGPALPQCVGGCPIAGQNCVDTVTTLPGGDTQHMCMCSNATEACCGAGGPGFGCSQLDPNACLTAGGIPQGVGTTCLGLEACCLPNGTCALVDRICCDDIGGVPQGAGSTCVDTNGNGTADVCECGPDPNGIGCNPVTCPSPGEECVPVKVKCTPSGANCQVIDCECMNPNRCHIDLPPPQPSMPQCVGGCPPDRVCEETITIDPLDGQFLHMCMCVETQACCLPNAAITCQQLTLNQCMAQGGIPQGPGTLCQGEQACCRPNGSCTFIDALCCANSGGTPMGPGSMCLGTGACCLDVDNGPFQYDTCQVADQVCCAGAFQGVGSTCMVEACCLPNGACQLLDPRCCVKSGGSPKGPGSNCADGDGNGQADACEAVLCEPLPDFSGCTNAECPCFGECIQGSYCDDPANPACCLDPGNCACYAKSTQVSIKLCGDCFGECINGSYCDHPDPMCWINGGPPVCYVPNHPISIYLCGNCFGECINGSYCDHPNPNCCVVPGNCACYVPTHPISVKMCGGQVEDCHPTCVNYNPVTGQSRVLDCACGGLNECHATVPEPGSTQRPKCVDDCPPGSTCETTEVQEADGSITTCCRCVSDCQPNPTGTACQPTICPIPGEQCRPKKIRCHPAFGCTVLECECTSNNECHVEYNPAIGAFCVPGCPTPGDTCDLLSTPNADGSSDFMCMCQPPPPECSPNPTGEFCGPHICPNANEECLPTKIRCSPGGDCVILSCDCVNFTQCHIELDSSMDPSRPVCIGDCPPGQICEDRVTTNPDGTTDHMCMCITPPFCEPNTSGSDCVPMSCPNVNEICEPTLVRCCPGAGCTVVACDCLPANECHVELMGGPICVNGCPAGELCERVHVTSADGCVYTHCRCLGQNLEACCLDNGNICVNTTPAACLMAGGVPQGPGTGCTIKEACCLGNGRCRFVDPLCCDDLGGTPRGPGTFCKPYGDIYPKPGDGIVEIGDVLKVLDAYADIDPCLNYPNAELVYDAHCPQNCTTVAECNGALPAVCDALGECCDGVDISEVLAILDAYAGNPGCPDDPCGP